MRSYRLMEKIKAGHRKAGWTLLPNRCRAYLMTLKALQKLYGKKESSGFSRMRTIQS
ncbi:hypothetical protein ACM5Q9_13075 [Advenella sp. RU8]|uniref:hypothetical protein n=1 Tax=Advenella sp. RU8 TaxID=3399575 RepID=UPI003AB0FBCA